MTTSNTIISADPAGKGFTAATAIPDFPARSVEFSGSGHIGRKTALAIAILFCVGISIPGVFQYIYDVRVLGRWEFDDLLTHRPTAASLAQFEKDLTQQSRFDSWARHTFWKLHHGGIKSPNTNAIDVASDGFLFGDGEAKLFSGYGLTSPAPAPSATIMPAILDFNAQLRRRGIRLILLPIPLKVSIYPEKLAIDYLKSDGPPLPPGYTEWMARVRQSGIDVIDLTPALWSARDRSPDPLYWPTDTHWSQSGRAVGADVVAAYVRPLVATFPRCSFDVGTTRIDFEGDLAAALALGWGNAKYPRIRYECRQLTRGGKPFVAGNEAPILLLGDSFTAFFNNDGCGLADELMLRLHTEVQAIGVPQDPINRPRVFLAENPNCLTSKKVLIWEFAARYMWRNWDMVTLPQR
ncbi:MAG: hypothetical protein ABSB42_02830 [Tepidisphaeraceae bacterium]|jgi:acetyltransferase AlgX (SGNH hydrolase-like protein)